MRRVPLRPRNDCEEVLRRGDIDGERQRRGPGYADADRGLADSAVPARRALADHDGRPDARQPGRQARLDPWVEPGGAAGPGGVRAVAYTHLTLPTNREV